MNDEKENQTSVEFEGIKKIARGLMTLATLIWFGSKILVYFLESKMAEKS